MPVMVQGSLKPGFIVMAVDHLIQPAVPTTPDLTKDRMIRRRLPLSATGFRRDIAWGVKQRQPRPGARSGAGGRAAENSHDAARDQMISGQNSKMMQCEKNVLMPLQQRKS